MPENKRKITGLAGLALLLLSGISAAAGREGGPQVEPFYLRLLKSGETAYIEGRFRDVVQELKVAVFGLYPDRRLLARGQALLGLSLAKTGDTEAGRESVEKALNAIGGAGECKSLELPAAAAADLAEAIGKWKLGPAPPASKPGALPTAPPSPVKTKPPETAAAAEEAADRIEELKRAVARDSRNTAAYTEMAQLRLRAGDAPAAKAVLKDMIKANPAEVEGYLSLGRICYLEKSYKEADPYLEKFLELASASGQPAASIAEARALRILAASLRDDSRRLRRYLAEYRKTFDGEVIDSLPLFPEDKVRLRSLLQTGG